MSMAPSAPPPARRPAPAGRQYLLAGVTGLLGVLILVLVGTNLLNRGPAPPPPTPSPGPATGTPGTPSATPFTANSGVTFPPASPATSPVATGPAITAGLGSPVATTAARLPLPQPSAPASGVLSGTPALGGATPPEGDLQTIGVVDAGGTAYACARRQGCPLPAAPGQLLYPGGEARTGADGTLHLQTPAGLLALAGGTTVQVSGLDDRQVALVLAAGRLLVRAAPGRALAMAVSTGPATVSATGSSFSVVALSGAQAGTRVAVPATAPRPAHVSTPNNPAGTDVPPGSQVDVLPGGALTGAGPLTPDETAALQALDGTAPGTTPAAVAQVTTLAVPSALPFPTDAVTATMVLTPPPEQTLGPLTVLPIGGPSATPIGGSGAAGTGTPGPAGPPAALASPTLSAPANLLAAAAGAMGRVTSYTFGATRGADPATAEFSAGSVAGDTACWIATTNGQRSDYQVRGSSVFLRQGTAPWQQQPDQHGLPAWLTSWQLLAQVDPATVADLGAAPLDAVTVHHLRARLALAAGADPLWIDAIVGADDHLVRSLILYTGDPGQNHPTLKIGFSSFGAALSCPPLTAP
ncbi:MAG TPA: hypothetical protein VKY74_27730 [Chloroflexia bacterium]|nr:hypothetical protein [Chloroflexia bacterium]